MMKELRTEDDGYLWDRSGPPDPEIERLEALLGPLRHRGVVPRVEARRPAAALQVARWIPSLSAAAMLLIVVAAAWFLFADRHSTWSVESVAGAPVVDMTAAGGGGVRVGERV